jgi:hypothetical protein
VLSAAAVGGAFLVAALLLARVAGGGAHAGELALRCLSAPFAVLDAAAHLGTAAGLGATSFTLGAVVLVVARQARRGRDVRRAVARARLPVLPPPVARAALLTGTTAWVDVVEARRPFAFVYGWRNPRVCVSTGLVDQLSAEELRAALLHERWHVMRRDPARLTIAVAIRCAFRFLPTFPTRVERYVVAVEVAADRFVVREMGHARALAGALLRLEPVGVAPGFAGQTDARVAALIDGGSVAARTRSWIAATVVAAEVGLAAALAGDLRIAASLGLVLVCAC